jgi:hypothetical protein
MSDAVPPKRKPVPAPPPRRPSRDNGESGPSLPALAVNYYKRMRPQHVYPVTVRWRAGRDAEPASHPVVVRLLGGGAQIVPSEVALDSARPDQTATFYVTPLALGPLRGVRLEVLHQGRKVQDIPLRMKSVRQTWTWVLLALTLLVTWFCLSPLKYNPLRGQEVRIPRPGEEGGVIPGDIPVKFLKKGAPKGDGKFGAKGAVPSAEMVRELQPGEILTRLLNDNIPRVLPQIQENAPDVAAAMGQMNPTIGETYQALYEIQTKSRFPLAYYAFWFMMALTFLSFLAHLERRKRLVSRPVPIPAAAAPPAAGRRAEPLAAEPGE